MDKLTDGRSSGKNTSNPNTTSGSYREIGKCRPGKSTSTTRSGSGQSNNSKGSSGSRGGRK